MLKKFNVLFSLNLVNFALYLNVIVMHVFYFNSTNLFNYPFNAIISHSNNSKILPKEKPQISDIESLMLYKKYIYSFKLLTFTRVYKDPT